MMIMIMMMIIMMIMIKMIMIIMMIMMMILRSDTDVFLESWSDYEPHEEYDDVYIETPIDYMEVSTELSLVDTIGTLSCDWSRCSPTTTSATPT